MKQALKSIGGRKEDIGLLNVDELKYNMNRINQDYKFLDPLLKKFIEIYYERR